jgi:hypothetical protein
MSDIIAPTELSLYETLVNLRNMNTSGVITDHNSAMEIVLQPWNLESGIEFDAELLGDHNKISAILLLVIELLRKKISDAVQKVLHIIYISFATSDSDYQFITTHTYYYKALRMSPNYDCCVKLLTDYAVRNRRASIRAINHDYFAAQYGYKVSNIFAADHNYRALLNSAAAFKTVWLSAADQEIMNQPILSITECARLFEIFAALVHLRAIYIYEFIIIAAPMIPLHFDLLLDNMEIASMNMLLKTISESSHFLFTAQERANMFLMWQYMRAICDAEDVKKDETYYRFIGHLDLLKVQLDNACDIDFDMCK